MIKVGDIVKVVSNDGGGGWSVGTVGVVIFRSAMENPAIYVPVRDQYWFHLDSELKKVGTAENIADLFLLWNESA